MHIENIERCELLGFRGKDLIHSSRTLNSPYEVLEHLESNRRIMGDSIYLTISNPSTLYITCGNN